MKRMLMITGWCVVLLGILPANLSAQGHGFCQLSYSGRNKDRKVMGPVSTECSAPHTVPFGNWGVNSNVGSRIDGHQFQGWCLNHWACDNDGNCERHCTDRWYEWNSCTTSSLWAPTNCTLYNSNGCTQQVTKRGMNTHGTAATDIAVSCPSDSDGDGFCDTGGCADVSSFTTSNWMTLYELDPRDFDDRVQKLNFPRVTVSLSCRAMSCDSETSSWVSPNSYKYPSSPALVDTKLSVKVLKGRYYDRDGLCAYWAERGRPGYNCR